MGKCAHTRRGRWRPWFALTPQEQLFVAGVVVILLVGLVARYLHLRTERADVYEPAGLEQAR